MARRASERARALLTPPSPFPRASPRRAAAHAAGKYNRGQHWLTYARELDEERDIVVLSAGPHVHGTPQLARVLARIAAEHAQAVPRLRVVWRSQFPGGEQGERSQMPLRAGPRKRYTLRARPCIA